MVRVRVRVIDYANYYKMLIVLIIMKTLSIKQPWAELIIQGKKTIELRNWNTKFRGRFLIHASKIPDKDAMLKFGFDELPVGKIIGEVELIDVKNYNSKESHANDKDKHLVDNFWGNCGFILINPKRIKPIDAKGMLGFWDFGFNKLDYL